MKSTVVLALAVALAALFAFVTRPGLSHSPPSSAAVPTASTSAPPVAVVELFTSEGCSSCPPADRLLVDLSERDEAGLIVLAFHVDYWNRLGWRDPFSAAAYSARQRAYARSFDASRVYTPQMIVNGRREFVGSRRREAEGAIRQALGQPAVATVSLQPRVRGDVVSVDYMVEDAPDDSVLHLALVQRRTEQVVPRGENKGRTLQHANVVRDFATMPTFAGAHTFALPDGVRAADAALIGYVQHSETMHITGAAQAGIDP